MGICQGNSEDHCCHLGMMGVCKYLEEDTMEGRKWVCSLYKELDSWEAVHSDERYLMDVRPFWESFDPELNCGSWPPKGEKCATCNIIG